MLTDAQKRQLNAISGARLGDALDEAAEGGRISAATGTGSPPLNTFVTLTKATFEWDAIEFGGTEALQTGVRVAGSATQGEDSKVAMRGIVPITAESDLFEGDGVKIGGNGRAQAYCYAADQVVDAAISAVDNTGITNPSDASALYISSDDDTDTMDLVIAAHGAASSDECEVVTLNGTTGVTTSGSAMTVILGLLLLESPAGTITIQEDDAMGATLATLSASTLSLGFAVPARQSGFLDVLQVNRGDAGTQVIAIVGYDKDNAFLSDIITLAGATDVNITGEFGHVLGFGTATMTDGDSLDLTLDAAEADALLKGVCVGGAERGGTAQVFLF